MPPLSSYKNPGETLVRAIEQIKDTQYVVSAGTALGLYRDGDLIPNDTDIDVDIFGDDHEPINALEGFEEYRFVDRGGKPMQRAFADKINGVVFDIYYHYVNGDVILNQNDFGVMEMPLHFFTNRQLLDTKYGKFYFPHPIEDFLVMRYGKDWSIPSDKKGLYDKNF
jgi:hypothetical protein